MARRPDGREVLLDAGQRWFLERGFHGAGLADLLAAAGIPKGSFYHYFPSKEAYAVAVATRYAEIHDELLRTWVEAEGSPIARLRGYFDAAAALFDVVGGDTGPGAPRDPLGCLLGGLATEMSDDTPELHATVRALFDRWSSRIAELIVQAQRAGEITTGVPPSQLADFALQGWEGALMQMRLRRDPSVLRAYTTVLFDQVLAPSG